MNECATDRRRTARIPVDNWLLYRVTRMEDFEQCEALSLSELSVEIVLDYALTVGTVVTLRANLDGRSCIVVGEVKRREPLNGKWIHVVVAPGTRPWPPMFVRGVVRSNFNPAPETVRAYMKWMAGISHPRLNGAVRELPTAL